MSDPKIVFTYHPREGEFVVGVPQRDLTQRDVDRAGAGAMRDAVGTGLYRPVKVEDNRTPAQKAADTKRAKQEAEAAAADAERRQAAAAEVTAAIEAANAAALNEGSADGAGDDDSGDAGEGNGE
jgi:hypothetical protein